MRLSLPSRRKRTMWFQRRDIAVFVGFASSGPLHVPVAVEDTARFTLPCYECNRLIKIDGEGFEEQIWHGMAKTLKRNHDVTLIMEINCAI